MMILCHVFLKSYLLETRYRPSTNGLDRGFASETAGRGCARALENGRRLSRPHTEHQMLLSHFCMFEILHNKQWKRKTQHCQDRRHPPLPVHIKQQVYISISSRFLPETRGLRACRPILDILKGEPTPLGPASTTHKGTEKLLWMRGFKTFDLNFETDPNLVMLETEKEKLGEKHHNVPNSGLWAVGWRLSCCVLSPPKCLLSRCPLIR